MEKKDDTPPPAEQLLFENLEDAPVDLSDFSWEDTIPFIFFWSLAIVVFLQFFTRYFLNNSLAWTEEIARYLLICVTFSGAIMAMRKRSHIAVEVLHIYLPQKLSHWILICVDAIVAGFAIYLAETAGRLAYSSTSFMVSIDIPKSIIYWTVSASFAGIAIYAIRNLYIRVRNPKDNVVSTAILD